MKIVADIQEFYQNRVAEAEVNEDCLSLMEFEHKRKDMD